MLHVEWNKPPYKPIPLSIDVKLMQSMQIIVQYINIMMVTLEISIDISRLNVTAIKNVNKNKPYISIYYYYYYYYYYYCSSSQDKNFSIDTDSITIGIELCKIPHSSEHCP